MEVYNNPGSFTCSNVSIYHLIVGVPPEKSNSTVRQKQGGRFNERSERQGDRSERQGDRERLDNRRQGEDRPPRTARGGGRQRLSSKEKDVVSQLY